MGTTSLASPFDEKEEGGIELGTRSFVLVIRTDLWFYRIFDFAFRASRDHACKYTLYSLYTYVGYT